MRKVPDNQNLVVKPFIPGIKPFSCETCGKTFSKQAHLRTHQIVHTKEKNFTCKICLHSFTLASSLRRHNLLHQGIKAYKCTLCPKNFTQSVHLKKHLLSHSGKISSDHFCTSTYRKSNLRNQTLRVSLVPKIIFGGG